MRKIIPIALHDIGKVPCNGCTLCCKGDTLRILPHEDHTQWVTEPHPTNPSFRMLAHKANGDCHYLGPTGCTIHGRTPQLCGEMDCRFVHQQMTHQEARWYARKGMYTMKLWLKGGELCRVYTPSKP